MSNKHIIYIDLDSIFDTRLTTVLKLTNNDLSILENNKWHTRERDEWNNVNTDSFIQEYVGRDKSTITSSSPTDILSFIREYNSSIIASNIESKDMLVSGLLLNIWPYKLSDEESELIGSGLQVSTITHETTRVISVDPNSIDYSFIIDNEISTIISYDYREIIEAISSCPDMKTNSLADIALFAPNLLYGDLPNNVSTKDEAITIVEEILNIYIGIKFIPVGYFSTPVALRKKQ